MADYPRQQYILVDKNYPRQEGALPPPPGFSLNTIYMKQPGAAHEPQGPTSLHEALNFASAGVIDKMLTDNPELIHERGFNGQGALHRAVLRIEPEVTQVILRHQGDPNLRNNHQETALHFAAKRGNPRVLHMLVAAGGDVTAVDRSGKGLLHHACHGGSVSMLHYLLYSCGLSPNVVDVNLKSPLMTVCEHGHPEAFEYLLRKERSDLKHRDRQGNTALHLCAKFCHPWLCWCIAQDGGLHLLNERNNDGFTPLDLALKETQTPRQKTVVSLLQKLAVDGRKSKKAECPVWLWYWYLLCPTILYGVTLTLCQVTQYKGYVMCVGAAVILTIVFQQSHRMKHPSRLPNPMYAGMFGAGLLYTSLCYLIVILPVIYPDSQLLHVFFVCLTVTVWYLYYRTLTVDPGVQRSARQREDGSYCDVMDIARGDINMEAFCKTCEIVPPVLTKHCKLCAECYNQLDHHCLFLYRCIAVNNHRLFVLLIGGVLGAMCAFQYAAARYISALYPGEPWSGGLVLEVFGAEPMVWSAVVANGFSIIWGIHLLKFQLKVVSKGQTTFFQPNRGRSHFTAAQRCRNIVLFLIGSKRYQKDPIILQNV